MSYERETDTETIEMRESKIEFSTFPPFIDISKYNEKCIMTINVEEKIYKHDEGSPHVYYINYSYEFIEKSGKVKKSKISYKHPCSPFYKVKNASDLFEGTIIYKNDMIEKILYDFS